MHLLFFSTILSLNHLTPYPLGSFSNISIQRNNETYIPNGCSRDDALKRIINRAAIFHGMFIENAAWNLTTSFLISPVLISIAMSLLRHGAVNNEYQQRLFMPLGIPSNECLHKVGMQALIDDLAGYKQSGLSMAGGVFASPRMQLCPAFVEVATKGFRSGIQRVDFDNAITRVKFIRGWCLDKNDRRAINFADSCAPHNGMSLAIMNALHLDAKWLHEFQVSHTRMRLFYDANGVSKSLVMMKTTGYFRHGSFPETNATFVELPFKSTSDAHNMSMFLIRPGEHEDAIMFLQFIRFLKIKDLIAQGSYGNITVEVPRFTIQNEVDIKMLLLAKVQGSSILEDIFERRANVYAGFDQTVRLRFARFVQKSVIDVSEGGVQAVTMDGISIPIPTGPTPFALNCPFYFIIATTGKNPVNLFAGRFNG